MPAMPARDPKREERLAAALRENLRKRKAQAREADKDASAPAKAGVQTERGSANSE